MNSNTNASLLVKPEIMRLPGLGRVLEREVELLQRERDEFVNLAERNLAITER